MCSSLFEMENYQGDLTDIVRGSRTTTTTFGCKKEDPSFSISSEMPINFSSSNSQLLQQQQQQQQAASSLIEGQDQYSFGDPFCAAAAMKDPLFQELDIICGTNSSSSFFNNSGGNLEQKSGQFSGFGVHEDELIQRPCNIFSRMLQISPATITNKFSTNSGCDSPLLIPNCNINSSSNPLIHANNSGLHHFVDHNNPSTLQISSPRNPAGIKRRKSQARKVVCVPAPVAASSRPNGEVIPSDLWAWRKYGQKPIKGSPYPRGYYRCSSSKGCSARKQVERSRTDPNMLVITYTSEHNHPWPTQRNALAGSSRSQQSKNNNTPNSSKLSQSQKLTTTTQEGSDKNNYNNNGTKSSTTSSNNVKEEAVEEIEKHVIETEEGDQFNEGFQYEVAMGSNNNNQSDDFFADLEELETDPLNLLFTQVQKSDQSQGSGGFDDVVAFNNLFDWAAQNNNSNNSFEEEPPPSASKRGFY